MHGSNGKRIVIGFLIHHLDNDYSKTLLKGAADAAKELDVDLAIFPGRSLNSQLDDKKFTAFEYQNNVIYNYVTPGNLDAAVLSAGTIGSFVSKETLKRFVDSFGGLPVITTENKVDGYPCVRLSSSGIKELISHLVQEHNRRNIAFVSGPKSNADAQERLRYYKEALAENGIEYDENMVAYGKFSEYCVDIVGELIDRNEGRIDAICFANDMMCKGGYKAIEERGLRVGIDIAVTGYDDSEVAVSLKPMLTTVRANAADLGRRAVFEAVHLAKGEKVSESINISSSPVYRLSCGCGSASDSRAAEISELLKSGQCDKAADVILEEFISNYEHVITLRPDVDRFRRFSAAVMRTASTGVIDSKDKPLLSKNIFAGMFTADFINLISPQSLLRMVRNIREAIAEYHSSMDALISDCIEVICEKIINVHYNKLDESVFTHFLISNITKDMTVYGSDEEKCFFSIVNNLYRVHMESSYIYTYDEPILHASTSEWDHPGTVLLKAYHDGDKLSALTGETSRISTDSIFSNEFTPEIRRRTMVVSPLFVNEEQYGIIVCELDNEHFPYIYSITPQICTAIKLSKLVAQLEMSLDAARSRNSVLNMMSMSDELTGIYNRRGFYVFANRILKAPENEGLPAVLIFGDLDYLKTINDTFGHDEGDYAIRSVASFIRKGLRNDDVVARIGGDEFAAFAICKDKDVIANLPERIKSIAREHNRTSDKPYNVMMSIGTYEILCSPDLNIQQFMEHADDALYADKKNKAKSVLKEG